MFSYTLQNDDSVRLNDLNNIRVYMFYSYTLRQDPEILIQD